MNIRVDVEDRLFLSDVCIMITIGCDLSLLPKFNKNNNLFIKLINFFEMVVRLIGYSLYILWNVPSGGSISLLFIIFHSEMIYLNFTRISPKGWTQLLFYYLYLPAGFVSYPYAYVPSSIYEVNKIWDPLKLNFSKNIIRYFLQIVPYVLLFSLYIKNKYFTKVFTCNIRNLLRNRHIINTVTNIVCENFPLKRILKFA